MWRCLEETLVCIGTVFCGAFSFIVITTRLFEIRTSVAYVPTRKLEKDWLAPRVPGVRKQATGICQREHSIWLQWYIVNWAFSGFFVVYLHCFDGDATWCAIEISKLLQNIVSLRGMYGTVQYDIPNKCKQASLLLNSTICIMAPALPPSTTHGWEYHTVTNALIVFIKSANEVTMTTADSFINKCWLLYSWMQEPFLESFRGPTPVSFSEFRFCRFLSFFSQTSLLLFGLKLTRLRISEIDFLTCGFSRHSSNGASIFRFWGRRCGVVHCGCPDFSKRVVALPAFKLKITQYIWDAWTGNLAQTVCPPHCLWTKQ